jgi:hypothetical protein
MKKNNSILLIAALALLLFSSASTVNAADPLFFKLGVSMKGYAVNGDDDSRLAIKTTVYMMYMGDSYLLAYQNSEGWQLAKPASISPVETDAAVYLPDHMVRIVTPDARFDMSLTARVLFKTKDGQIIKARFISLGAHVIDGQLFADSAQLYGGASVKGALIAFEKMPEDVQKLFPL